MTNTIDFTAIIDEYSKTGFTVVPNAITESDRAAFLSSAAAAYDAEPWLDIGAPVTKKEDMGDLMKRRHARLDAFLPRRRELMLTDKVYEYLYALMSDEPVLMSQNIPFRYSLSHALHTAPDHDPERNGHVHHYAHIEPVRACIIGWLALEDITLSAGPMWVSPGSHKENVCLFDDLLNAYPELGAELLRLRQTGGPYKIWADWFMRMQKRMTAVIEDRIDHEKRERLPVLVKGGDLVLFDPALSHGTLAPADLSATRWSMVGKYQGRHAIERSWASWFGSSIYEPALKHVLPASFDIARLEGSKGFYAIDFSGAHYKMFWSEPLPA